MKFSSRAIVCAVAGIIALSGCAKHAAQTAGPPPLNVDVGRAAQRDIATYLTLDGQVAPVQEATLSVQQSGPLIDVYVNEGDRVRQGQLLAKVDDSTLRATLTQDEALISQASARAQSSALNVPITAQQVSSGVVNAQQQLATARNNLVSAQAAYQNARLVFSSNQQLFNQGYVSRTQFEQSRSAYVAAQQQIGVARQGIASAEAALRTAQGNTQQTGVQSANASADRAAIASAQAQARVLQTQIAQTALYAPFGGVVTARLMDPGAMAGPQQPVLRLSQVDTVYINANVPDEDLAYVHPGTPISFQSGTLPGKTFTGTIATVNAVPTQGTLSYRARVRQTNPGSLLRGGMLVTMTVRKEHHPGAVVVPRTAVNQTERGANVFIVAGGKAMEVPVILGLQTDALSEVRSPRIRPGTVVITTRPDALQNGSMVAISGRPAR